MMQNKARTYDLAVIGAGASGLFTCALIELICAGKLEQALERAYVEADLLKAWQPVLAKASFYQDLSIVLIEGQAKAGKKLCLTGGGRCNLASNLSGLELLKQYHEAFNFLRPTWSYFSPNLLRSLLFSMGISTYWDEKGRLYPVSNSAKSVRDQLLAYASQNPNLAIVYQTQIQAIKPLAEANSITNEPNAFRLKSANNEFVAKRVILASGGFSVPNTGSNGELANALAKLADFNCTLVEPKAALAPLIWQGQAKFPLSNLAGISLHDVKLTLQVKATTEAKRQYLRRFGRELVHASSGDLLITKQGLSGPVALNISRFFTAQLANELTVEFLSEANLASLKQATNEKLKAKSAETLAKVWQQVCPLPARLLDYLWTAAPNYPKRSLKVFTETDLAEAYKIFTWSCNNFVVAPLQKATATCGGIALTELDPKSLALKAMPNCYVVGELMNVDANCGGFNLLHAFASSSLVVRALV
ncbi:aminoacetone oxidase family FAD-binding enzyme [Amygdalobacter nucleatus]|uniref:Flavoprotein family protein n=1 Tax=Amygdalobacter nucleatus TaxID=3029274 RepID=A0A133Y9M2_9FIRM|nr:aminoacetone oxidase family FAD-binding enzyme [Amygdalobacter nucleatus]KXB39902.1 flavoprotein family protein [Amygdalobacter nucleatus]MDF0485340.1 aminoacetone oxidase family FAD-binding enzyme [Amygdalobacter nucleatus]